MKSLVACLFLVMAAFNEASATNFTNCPIDPDDPPTGKLVSVDLQDCQNGQICNLKSGTSKTISFDFVPSVADEVVEASAYLKCVLHMYVGFEVPNSDACESKILQCPLTPGETYTYKNTIEIPKKEGFAGETELKFEIRDGPDTIVCFLIPAVAEA